MADRSSIEWTDATWTPIKGCSRHSPGCINCYAEIMAARFSQPGQWGEGLARIVDTPQGKDHRWTGVTRFDDKELLKPMGWKKPRRIFVCSTSDLFHESVPDEWIDQVFAVMALCPQHIFQVLTKRADRMREYLTARKTAAPIMVPVGDGTLGQHPFNNELKVPSNIWLGVSVEDHERALLRIPDLLATPAAVRWLSCEPMLGPIFLTDVADGCSTVLTPECWGDCDCSSLFGYDPGCRRNGGDGTLIRKIDWVVVGGESGPGARPMDPEWPRTLRDDCHDADVPFFFKQWGAHVPCGQMLADGRLWANGSNNTLLTTKKFAGRFLDGVQHDGMPA
ncbi:DUF5131 family protein [Sphingobium agri]|uniref:Phage Gp37/Gp68 family protein n=1 Tax=Sphingobium agri TaxID=2933566 RepID=A0ABT0DXB8_9SPHN|nr:phage Gp37/Gp68 family protein [Sphingobium agri]MCK0531756.1 phage Gp37/Gp68 family protein [Sphingobium agri]